MKRLVFGLACFLLAGCADSRLTFEQRAYVHCRETGAGAGCQPDTIAAWNNLYPQCSARSSFARRCNADFDAQYWCSTKRKVERITNAKGETTTKETEIEHGPGCMPSYERSRLQERFREDCMYATRAPQTDDAYGAWCSCGDSGCSVRLPSFGDSTIEKYFPGL